MPLKRSDVEHIAALARIGLTDEELEMFRDQLSNILEQFQVLDQLDTTGVVPTGHVGELNLVLSEAEGTVMREDIPGDCLTSQEVLRNAPRTEGEFIRVKPVLSDVEGSVLEE